jgi:hypothetical protein
MFKEPGLYGIKHSNRDFTKKETWGKNQFNTSFPAALLCYMNYKGIKPVYIMLDEQLKTIHKDIEVEKLFGINPNSDNLFFAFESDYAPFRRLVAGSLPRMDLIIMDRSTNQCLRGFEVKLTALPDNSTCELDEKEYGCEIVTRPDTIVYLASCIASEYWHNREKLRGFLEPVCKEIKNWESEREVLNYVRSLADAIDSISIMLVDAQKQKPLVIQPIWKTIGKKLELHPNCFDAFIWSDIAFARLFIDKTKKAESQEIIDRPMRSTVWLAKMLYEFALTGQFNFKDITYKLSYKTRNDKAFAVNGRVTNPYLFCNELLVPRIRREEIRNLILGGGHKFLSPERRLDAAILSTPGLFDNDS